MISLSLFKSLSKYCIEKQFRLIACIAISLSFFKSESACIIELPFSLLPFKTTPFYLF